MKADFRIPDGKALAVALEGLKERVRRKTIKDALLEVARPVMEESARTVRRSRDTFHIADNMVLVSTRRQRDLPSPDAQAVAWGPAKGLFYGYFLEYGTVFMHPRPFMRPPFELRAGGMVSALGSAIWLELRDRGVDRRSVLAGLAG
jgi:HK97 gp10 family phage protein